MADTFTPTDEQRAILLDFMAYNKIFQTKGTGHSLDNIEVLQPWSYLDLHQLAAARSEQHFAFSKLHALLLLDTADVVAEIAAKFPEATTEDIETAILRTRAYVITESISTTDVQRRALELMEELSARDRNSEEAARLRALDGQISSYLLGEDE